MGPKVYSSSALTLSTILQALRLPAEDYDFLVPEDLDTRGLIGKKRETSMERLRLYDASPSELRGCL
ncbi:hypothetical protein B9Q03_04645 [Candidatus Marsarchaeota G2 archaeon OSP_D]|uniref:Uncharacterized protein n=4 Tax=Candidatus Marsarchaeota group 2 TaxID=2203771 RepID=A0A2R6B9B7_9ARCH|nr:MAG: hypothetical protein B9Q03_04645 [Candidatus Marsarchaeota G2 archaeon OSP_D]PSN95206.1 MAG: hypothetical protein B9Q06_06315 [Candidatus Marsarchaeota G2 archaeon ECH_B_2]PSN99885.1 MAG: hypothetical protein B9Q07_05700 [Candidatus Marsarchaeota G2 archaeon ECH_B_3]PSO02031.1 MAG: hypothetical protein B9Q05_06415 [Candidatus Marsarchaeota G2 archaeon ECH_B_1]